MHFNKILSNLSLLLFYHKVTTDIFKLSSCYCSNNNCVLLKLIKVEAGLCEGEVIYHDLIKKTPEEIARINKRREEKR